MKQPLTPVADSGSVGALLDWARMRLASRSGSSGLDAEVLLGFALDRSRSSLIGFPELGVSAAETARFRRLVEQRAAGVPVAYLTGRREFHSLTLNVSPATLVPRPETELLVDKVLERLAPGAGARVLDAGAGCGAVAVAIKYRRPDCQVVGVDRSGAALEIAAGNGARFGLDIHWVRSDWYAGIAGGRFQFVVSNPPYVRRDDPALTSPDLRHEPLEALDGGAEGLDSLRAVIAGAPRVLTPRGTLLLEHGFDQAQPVRELLDECGFRAIETHRDSAGLDRVSIGELA